MFKMMKFLVFLAVFGFDNTTTCQFQLPHAWKDSGVYQTEKPKPKGESLGKF